MFNDIKTVMWKEWRTLARFQGKKTQLILIILTPTLMAIYFPWETGLDWLTDGISLLPVFAVSMMLVMTTIPDSFAGERERRTLRTLLASRLPDQAIFIGKMVVSIILAFGMVVLVMILGLITVNVIHGEGQFLFYDLDVLGAALLLGLLTSTLVAGIGVPISLKAETVQNAQQTLGAILLVPPMVLQIGVMVLLQTGKLKEILDGVSFSGFILVVSGALLLIDTALVYFGMRRFQRSRLILD